MGKFNLDSKLSEIAKDEKAREIVESFLPGQIDSPQFMLVQGLRVRDVLGKGHYVGLTPEQENSLVEQIMEIKER
jgi:hypothetical protein